MPSLSIQTMKPHVFFIFFALALLTACGATESKESVPALHSGISIHPIINGSPSTAPEHAAVLQMLYMGSEICTATLITDTVVLTAAHCVYVKDCEYNFVTQRTENCQLETNPARFTFRVGKSASDPSRQTRTATAIHAHDGYDDEYLFNDIALLTLGSSFQDVTPIPALPGTSEMALSPADVGQEITYLGFGLTETHSSGTRLQVSSTVDYVCTRSSSCTDNTGFYAPSGTFCSDMSAGGTCSGDSGGPALLIRDGVTYVAGVTSFGDEDCEFSGCNTSVSAFADWIAVYIGSNLADGTGCVLDSQCTSGFCTQGICCNERCGASLCEACSIARGASKDGVCAPITVCLGEMDCTWAGVCEPTTGECVYESKPSNTVCDDGDACTLDDHCLLGQCIGSGSVYCPPPNECQLASDTDTCQPETGACVYENLPDGTVCSDGKKECRNGVCISTASSSGGGCSAAPAQPLDGILALLILGIYFESWRKKPVR